MYVRTALIRVSNDRAEQVRRVYKEILLPGMRAYPGNVFAHCLVPVTLGEPWLVITGWGDRQVADTYGSSPEHDAFVAKVGPLLEPGTIYRQYQPIE
jgi:quinol monooxygenase YgiN